MKYLGFSFKEAFSSHFTVFRAKCLNSRQVFCTSHVFSDTNEN